LDPDLLKLITTIFLLQLLLIGPAWGVYWLLQSRARNVRISASVGVAVLSGGLIAWFLGLDPRLLMGGAAILSGPGPPAVQNNPPPASRSGVPADQVGRFVSKVLGSTEGAWQKVFAEAGQTYQPSILVLYAGVTRAPCGDIANSAVGPFYCAQDRKVYL